MKFGVTRGAALYVGALMGPGVLLVPALATQAAGPAVIVAWGVLLLLSIPLAITFAALGTRYPEAGGTAAYARAAFGAPLSRATGWLFLGGVVIGAPVVAYAGGRYVGDVTGLGTLGITVISIALVAIVLAINARGLGATARMQLGLTSLLAVLIAVAVVVALPDAEAANWTPFAPHGWLAVGTAGSVLMFSFIGWEAVSHLAGELRDPKRQLPRAIAAAFAVIALLYAGLAFATIGVLGPDPSAVPLADLMGAGLGETGRRATVVIAIALTVGTMTTYVAGALKLSGTLVRRLRPAAALAILGGVSALALGALAVGAVGADGLTRASAACFVGVYVLATAAGVRLLRGPARLASTLSFLVTLALLGFNGAFAAVPVALAAVAGLGPVVARITRRRRPCPEASAIS